MINLACADDLNDGTKRASWFVGSPAVPVLLLFHFRFCQLNYENMALFSKDCVRLWFVVTLMTARVSLGEGSDQDLDQSTVDLSSETKPWGVEPGDTAPAFRVPTLDGELIYSPGALPGALIIHAFTHKSGFLECLWNNESSLSALVRDLPDSTQVLFLSLDDSAVDDALWMRRQVHQAALQHG